MKKLRGLTAIGCSIYGGLFTLGVKRAGFRVLAHLEQDAYGTETALLNHPELDIYVGKDAWPERFDNLDLIFCNPPCAVWSGVGASTIGGAAASKHWRDDPRLQHAYDALELVERYQPKIWVWESVQQALLKGRTMILEMAERGRELGYAVSVLRFNAMHLGVPQDRPRVFVVLHRVAFEPGPLDYDTILTVRDAWKGLRERPRVRIDYEQPSPHELALLPNVPAGASLLRVYDQTHDHETSPRNKQGRLIGRPAIPERRLAFDKPGIAMLSKSFHPTAQRRITIAEALRICQLPNDWKFAESHPYQKKCLLMRAVMPRVGAWLATAAAAAIRAGRPADPAAPAIVYDLRRPERELYRLDDGPEAAGGGQKRALGASERAAATKATSKPVGRRLASRPRVEKAPRPPPSEDAIAKAQRVCANTTSGSGARIRALILKGDLSDDQIVEKILAEFDGHKTTRSDVSWNRGMLRKAGLLKENTGAEKDGQRDGARVHDEVQRTRGRRAAAVGR